MPRLLSEQLIAESIMRANKGLDALAVLSERGLRGSQDRDNRILLLDEDFAAEFARETGDPGLNRPGCIDIAAREQQDQLGVLRWNDLGVATVDSDFKPALAKPDAGVDVLRVAELRRG